MRRIAALVVLISMVLCCSRGMAAEKRLKVYILAGQSNMEGHAGIETFDYIGDDPATAPMLTEMRGPDGNPRICEKVWISYYTGGGEHSGEGFGQLTAGYGARGNPTEDGGKIGPEFTFGIYASKAYDGPILLIKTAWGGKSLNTDFRSPSAGPYQFSDDLLAMFKQQGRDIEAVKAEKANATGRYYRLMTEHVKKVLADPKRVCPAYDENAGFELAGFFWFQGWNDMCDSHTYPKSNEPGGYAEYSRLMAHFIRDVRKELSAPDMRFVIAVIGVGGDKAEGGIANLRPAMAAPAEMPEFKGNVAAVHTAPFWDYAMEALEPKKELVNFRLESAYVLDDNGVRDARDAGTPGWEPMGTPRPEDRVWRFTSFEPQNENDQMPKTEKKRFRDVALPEGLQQWQSPEFDDGKWNSGKAPVGLGVWKHRCIGNATVKYNSDWGKGEFLLMRTTFEVDNLDYESFRLSILARQGFHVYLNGHKIHTYIWWKDEPYYRPIGLTPEETKHLRKGVNVLAAYANVQYDGRAKEPHAAIDFFIEGITSEGKKLVDSAEYKARLMDKVCTRQEQRIIQGSSNAGYHYLGSAKILGQIGKACAEAMQEMEKR